MVIDTTRLEPGDVPVLPNLIWGQGPSFNNRLVQEINSETSLVQLVIYRLTVSNITDALLNKWTSGVPVQLMIEPNEYINKNWPEFWLTHAYLDKLWAAGVPIKMRAHQGLTHMKTLVTSNFATNASSNFAAFWQRDVNYFIPKATKPTIYQKVKDRVTAMWNDPAAFTDFVPLPPDAPELSAPYRRDRRPDDHAACLASGCVRDELRRLHGTVEFEPLIGWECPGPARQRSAGDLFLYAKRLAQRDDIFLADCGADVCDGSQSVTGCRVVDRIVHDGRQHGPAGRCVQSRRRRTAPST